MLRCLTRPELHRREGGGGGRRPRGSLGGAPHPAHTLGGVPEPYRLRVVAHSLGGASLLIYVVMCRRLGRPHHLYRLILLTPAGFLEKLPLVGHAALPDSFLARMPAPVCSTPRLDHAALPQIQTMVRTLQEVRCNDQACGFAYP